MHLGYLAFSAPPKFIKAMACKETAVAGNNCTAKLGNYQYLQRYTKIAKYNNELHCTCNSKNF